MSDVMIDANSSFSSSSSSSAPTDFNVNTNTPLLMTNESERINEGIDERIASSVSLTVTLSSNSQHKSTHNDNNGLKRLLCCPICTLGKDAFFCADCIKNGDFTYSKGRLTERFAEKKLKFFKLKEEQFMINEAIVGQLQPKVTIEEMEYNIKTLQLKIQYLKDVTRDAHKRLNSSQLNLEKIVHNQKECHDNCTRLSERINDFRNHIESNKVPSIDKKNEEKDIFKNKIRNLVSERVSELTAHIFPIGTNALDSGDSGPISTSEVTPLLAYSGSTNSHSNYSIVEPWIPGNGDYSAYTAIPKRDNSKPDESRNAEYRIGAALAYTAQFVNVLSYFLDIRLPKRVSFMEFCDDLDEIRFTNKVAKLNANILYLCISQNIDTGLLQPKATMKNLFHLLNPAEPLLGLSGPIIIGKSFLELIEDSLLEDLMLVDEPDVNDCDFREHDEELIDFDWVDRNDLERMTDLHMSSGQQTTSYTTGGIMSTAAASVASIWRTYTGQR